MARRKTQPYVARRRNKDADDSGPATTSVRWWTAKTGIEAADLLWTWCDRLRAQWSIDGIGDLIHEAIYADEPIARGGTFDGMRWSGGAGRSDTQRCPLNVLKSLVDTGTARLTKVRAMPCISANNAPYSKKRFARSVSAVLRTKMGGEDIESASPLAIRDFLIRGTSVLKTEPRDGDTYTIRIPIYELVWDHREAQFGWPRTFAHVRPESRETLLARYPDYEEVIQNASPFTRTEPWMQFTYQGVMMADLVELSESWHLPACKDDDNGQHIIAIRGHTILREPWTVPRYPLAFAWWTPPTRGVRGTGLVYEHSAAQEWINDILGYAHDGLKHAGLKVVVPRAANVNKNHLKAKWANVIEIDGMPGQMEFIAPDPVSKQAWAIAFQMKDAIYALSGIPQWQAESKTPLGNGASGKAIDTMNDNASDRFANVEMIYQQQRVHAGRSNVDIARMLADPPEHRFDEQPDPLPKKELAAWIRNNNWKDVDIDSGDFSITLEPINFITGTRGGRLEEAAEAAKAGLIPDPSMTADLFDEPDIQRMNRSTLGPIHRIQACIEGLTDLDVPYMNVAPDDTMNLDLAKLMVLGELEELKADAMLHEDAEADAIMSRFDSFLSDLKAKKSAIGSLPGAMPNTQVAQPGAGAMLPSAGSPAPGGQPPLSMPMLGGSS